MLPPRHNYSLTAKVKVAILQSETQRRQVIFMATVKDIAEKCGVSIGTVDRVLHNRGRVNPATRQRVLEAAEQLQYVPNRAAQRLAVRKKKLHLGFVAHRHEAHPFFDEVNRAAMEKAEELKEFGVTVSFLYDDISVLDDGSYQVTLVVPEGLDLDSLDGIATPGTISALIREDGTRRNVPVVFYNIAPPDHDGILSVSSDYYKSGTIAAGLCALTGGKHAKIAVITEGSNSAQVASYNQRMIGFRRRMEEGYPDCEIVGPLFIHNDRNFDEKLLRDFFRKNPGISAVYLVNPGNYDVCRIIRELDPEKKVSIITNDLVPMQEEMLRSGIISATITQEPEKQGAMPLDALFRYLAFGELPENKVYYTQLDIRIASNL